MSKHLEKEPSETLYKAIMTLKNEEECHRFLEDLCTISEIKAMAQRFLVAVMLDEQRVYPDIEQETGASSATISRVNKSLLYGEDGYRLVLERLRCENNE